MKNKLEILSEFNISESDYKRYSELYKILLKKRKEKKQLFKDITKCISYIKIGYKKILIYKKSFNLKGEKFYEKD